MSYFISGAILLTGAYNANQASKARRGAEENQRQALAAQDTQAALMREQIAKQTEAYRAQGASLQQQADTAKQQFEAQQLQYKENKLAMDAKAKEVQAAADEERCKAAASEASALKARTRGGRRSLLSSARADAELGVPVSLSSGPMSLQ